MWSLLHSPCFVLFNVKSILSSRTKNRLQVAFGPWVVVRWPLVGGKKGASLNYSCKLEITFKNYFRQSPEQSITWKVLGMAATAVNKAERSGKTWKAYLIKSILSHFTTCCELSCWKLIGPILLRGPQPLPPMQLNEMNGQEIPTT